MDGLAAAAAGAGLDEAGGVCPLKLRTRPSARAAEVRRSPKRSAYLVADCVRTVTADELSRELNQISEYQDRILWVRTGDSYSGQLCVRISIRISRLHPLGNCARKVNPSSFLWWASVLGNLRTRNCDRRTSSIPVSTKAARREPRRTRAEPFRMPRTTSRCIS